MFYRQNKTFWYQFCNLNIFWKQKIVKTVWPVRDTASQWSLLSLYLSWVSVGTTLNPVHEPLIHGLPNSASLTDSGIFFSRYSKLWKKHVGTADLLRSDLSTWPKNITPYQDPYKSMLWTRHLDQSASSFRTSHHDAGRWWQLFTKWRVWQA